MADNGMGRRVHQRRIQLGLGLRELSRRAGMQPSQLSGIEHGTRQEILSGTLRRLARELGVTTDWLVGMHEEYRDEEETEKLVSSKT